MESTIVVAALAGVPLLLSLLLRVGSVHMLLSVFVGEVLASRLGDDAAWIFENLFSADAAGKFVRLFLFFLPVLLTLIFLRKKLPGKAMLTQFLPLLAVSVMTAMLALEYVPGGVRAGFYSSEVGSILQQAGDVFVAGTAVFVLISTWFSARKAHHGHGKH